jgi:hypothetical protein
MGRISDTLSDVDYEQHEDTLEVELAGHRFNWYIGRVTFDLVDAHEDDVSLSAILQGAEALDEATPKEQIDQVGRLIWAGLLPFEEDLSYEVVARAISLQDLPRLGSFVSETFDALQDDAEGLGATPTETDALEDTPAGKAPGPAKTKAPR